MRNSLAFYLIITFSVFFTIGCESKENFLIGKCQLQVAKDPLNRNIDPTNYACNSDNAKNYPGQVLAYQKFNTKDIELNLIFGKWTRERIPSSSIPEDKFFKFPISYAVKGGEIETTVISRNGCIIKKLYIRRIDGIFSKSISQSGNCDESQRASHSELMKNNNFEKVIIVPPLNN